MIGLLELSEKLKKETNVAIFSHIRPDGDTVGSSIGLAAALRSMGVKADIFCADRIPKKFSFLDGYGEFSNAELNGEYSAFIAVDCAEIGRLGSYGVAFQGFKNTYNIDHHVSNTRYAKVNFVLDKASASEIIYSVVKTLGVSVTEKIANALATGVITDTGNFRHKSVTLSTMQTATELFSFKADFNKIIYNTFNLQSKERALLFGRTMEKIRYFQDGKVAVGIVRLKDFEETGALQEETEGFIDFIMGINGVHVGVCVMETEPDKYKISFRSQGEDVNAVAGMFGGGGHTLASGCRIAGTIEEVIDRLTFAISRVVI